MVIQPPEVSPHDPLWLSVTHWVSSALPCLLHRQLARSYSANRYRQQLPPPRDTPDQRLLSVPEIILDAAACDTPLRTRSCTTITPVPRRSRSEDRHSAPWTSSPTDIVSESRRSKQPLPKSASRKRRKRAAAFGTSWSKRMSWWLAEVLTAVRLPLGSRQVHRRRGSLLHPHPPSWRSSGTPSSPTTLLVPVSVPQTRSSQR